MAVQETNTSEFPYGRATEFQEWVYQENKAEAHGTLEVQFWTSHNGTSASFHHGDSHTFYLHSRRGVETPWWEKHRHHIVRTTCGMRYSVLDIPAYTDYKGSGKSEKDNRAAVRAEFKDCLTHLFFVKFVFPWKKCKMVVLKQKVKQWSLSLALQFLGPPDLPSLLSPQ